MLVARSFKYSSPPTDSVLDEKHGRRPVLRTVVPRATPTPPPPPPPAETTSRQQPTTEPVKIPSKQPNAHTPVRTVSAPGGTHAMTLSKSATLGRGRRKPSAHDPNALPPAVAALLAVTAIPPRRVQRHRHRSNRGEQVSIDQLISQWKSDEALNSTLSSSPALSILLEDANTSDEVDDFRKESVAEEGYLNSRSMSSESMPDLEADEISIFSQGSPSTPGSLRSHRSCSNLKKDKARSLPVSEACAFDHPLISRPEDEEEEDDDLLLAMKKMPAPAAKPKASFTSNLTTSLQSLKNAAINSISSFSRMNTAPSPSSQHDAAPPIDDMLWSHPYLFPRFSSEIRPAIHSVPTEAQRRYLNPMPPTFEEQEAPFQQALHAPYLAESTEMAATTIQMQTYRSRGGSSGRRRASLRHRTPDPSSEAGRALLGPEGVRQREVRENSDFLRVVVLEMNMRREGKLESGRAKIWLPPRVVSPGPGAEQRMGKCVPRRWVGENAYTNAD